MSAARLVFANCSEAPGEADPALGSGLPASGCIADDNAVDHEQRLVIGAAAERGNAPQDDIHPGTRSAAPNR